LLIGIFINRSWRGTGDLIADRNIYK
jgi:hypothetical protein